MNAMRRQLKFSISFTSRYRETYCTYCQQQIHSATAWLPPAVSELIGKARFRAHRHTPTHKANRPTDALAPALQIDHEAFERRRRETS